MFDTGTSHNLMYVSMTNSQHKQNPSLHVPIIGLREAYQVGLQFNYNPIKPIMGSVSYE